MLQQPEPDDYVIATGSSYSVREFLERAFTQLELKWQDFVEQDTRYFRPTEVDMLLGDASKARKKLGWQPTVDLDELITMMLGHDMDLAKQEKILRDAGHTVSAGRL